MRTYQVAGMTMVGDLADEQVAILNKRHKFATEYAASKGWGDLKSLTIAQIMEIRDQAGWKEPK